MPFELSRDVEKLSDFLEKRTSASYDEISKLLDRDVLKARHILSSARRRMERAGIYFLAERGVGLVRASNANVASLATAVPIKKVGRLVRRAEKREMHVNTQDLSADDRLAFAIGRTVVRTMKDTVSRSMRAKIAKEIEKNDGEVVTLQQIVTLPRLRKKS